MMSRESNRDILSSTAVGTRRCYPVLCTAWLLYPWRPIISNILNFLYKLGILQLTQLKSYFSVRRCERYLRLVSDQ